MSDTENIVWKTPLPGVGASDLVRQVVNAEPKFKINFSAKLGNGRGVFASPAIQGHRLFILSNKFLYCIGSK